MSDVPWSRRAFLAGAGRAVLGVALTGAVAGCSTDGVDDSAGGAEEADGPPAPLQWERAAMGFVSAYVLVRDGEAAVFDTGTGDDIGPIAAALEAAGVGWGDVGHVLVSHRHGDHLGGVDAVLAEAPDATAYAAAPDLDALRDRVPGAVEVMDGDRVLGLRVVATPGHTPGHVSAYAEDAGVLLTGDALVNAVRVGGTSGEGVEGSPPDFTDDADAAVASVRLLADLGATTLLFGHGEPLTADAVAELQAYADQL